MKLDEAGFTFCNLFHESTIPWSSVDEFFVVCLPESGKIVGFNFVPEYGRQRTARKIAVAVGGCEGALPETYGLPAEELAALLNSCHEAYAPSATDVAKSIED